MTNKKNKKGGLVSPMDLISNPKSLSKLIKALVPVATEIAKGIIESQNQTLKTKKTKAKKKLDSRHDYCKCGAVKTKASKLCRTCTYKKKK